MKATTRLTGPYTGMKANKALGLPLPANNLLWAMLKLISNKKTSIWEASWLRFWMRKEPYRLSWTSSKGWQKSMKSKWSNKKQNYLILGMKTTKPFPIWITPNKLIIRFYKALKRTKILQFWSFKILKKRKNSFSKDRKWIIYSNKSVFFCLEKTKQLRIIQFNQSTPNVRFYKICSKKLDCMSMKLVALNIYCV